eukprot:GHRQ01028746.1.p2 GENE.GHRQ01028746.1~~GHRQ01028746.1.p2  ORF type:complete len:101 (-),score=25.53 GHRQ01028746.1:348-650(-)
MCHSYWGRRAFERHFKEWRHVNGMKALGIPNNKDFYEVTKIEDALSLWKNIQVGGEKAPWCPYPVRWAVVCRLVICLCSQCDEIFETAWFTGALYRQVQL